MTIERDPDPDATVKMPAPLSKIDEELEEVDPEQTLAREDWETTVIRRVAPHVEAVQSALESEDEGEERFGWESEGLRRLSREVQQHRND